VEVARGRGNIFLHISIATRRVFAARVSILVDHAFDSGVAVLSLAKLGQIKTIEAVDWAVP
jgi:hypothetical protein